MATVHRQSGFSLMGVLFWGVIIGLLFLVGAQVVPSVSEYREISRAANSAANAGTTVPEIRGSFDKQVAAGYIFSIASKDLDITKNSNGKVVVGFAYQKKLPLFGPVSLVIDYSGSATAR